MPTPLKRLLVLACAASSSVYAGSEPQAQASGSNCGHDSVAAFPIEAGSLPTPLASASLALLALE
ncbi:hypothetical protein [Geothrix sp. 21YS21S-4]|uniref:hypothetical protein n=1 Tax=Geothrix sp. 21YS21S-4 TaxID=3068889 RepID=UPI0027BAC8DF|nr:hypothetical protein [Geothrix sp. 21YS21S-4]